MTRQAIIVFAVLLGAGLAGLLWYQLTRAPADQIAVVTSPTPVVSESPLTTATLTPTPQQITAKPTPAPVAVSNTAPTGASAEALALTVVAMLAGGYGLRRAF